MGAFPAEASRLRRQGAFAPQPPWRDRGQTVAEVRAQRASKPLKPALGADRARDQARGQTVAEVRAQRASKPLKPALGADRARDQARGQTVAELRAQRASRPLKPALGLAARG